MSRPQEHLKFSVVASTYGADLREAARLAREAGFAGLQLDIYTPAMRIPDLSASGRRELGRVLAGQEQQLVGLRLELAPKGLGPGADVDRVLHHVEQAMQAAAELAAPLLCIDLGPLPQPLRAAPAK